MRSEGYGVGSMCVCVCVSTLIYALRAAKRMMSDTDGFSVTSARKMAIFLKQLRSSLVPRPSRAPARTTVWYITSGFLVVLSQHAYGNFVM